MVARNQHQTAASGQQMYIQTMGKLLHNRITKDVQKDVLLSDSKCHAI